MSNDRRRRGADFDSERTIPSGLRREPPRIATPLAPELQPSPAPAARRPGSMGAPPVGDTSTPVPAVPQLPAPNPLSALPIAAAPSSPPPAGPERSSRSVGAIIERVRDTADPRRESGEEKPVQPSPQAMIAAAALAQPAAIDSTALNRTTIVTSAAALPLGDFVRVHRMAPPPKLDPRLVMLREPDSRAAAAFRVLRHRLGERAGLRTLLVTSAERGEGKTLCAANLAIALGEAGRARVLLVEANFRRPTLAHVFGIRPPVCFAEQLERHRAMPSQPWVVVENVSPFLHIAAVAIETAARPLMDGPALAMCMDQLRGAGYEYIILDGPAVLGNADVNLIEESVDGILFTMWARRSRGRALRKAVQQVGSAKVVGVTLLGPV